MNQRTLEALQDLPALHRAYRAEIERLATAADDRLERCESLDQAVYEILDGHGWLHDELMALAILSNLSTHSDAYLNDLGLLNTESWSTTLQSMAYLAMYEDVLEECHK